MSTKSVIAIVLLLGAYFAWVCLEMSNHVRTGDRILGGIAGVVVVAVLAGVLGARRRSH